MQHAKRKAKSRQGPPKSKVLNEAILNHQLWRIAHKGIKNRRCFNERLNQIAEKLKIPTNQEEWKKPRVVAKKLRQAIKTRRKIEKEATSLKEKELNEKITKKLT